MKDYSDIIHHPYSGIVGRQRLSMEARAAQFAPFAALHGHDEALAESGRRTQSRIELSESEQAELSSRLSAIMAKPAPQQIEVVRYIPDRYKNGGRYISQRGTIKSVDTTFSTITIIPTDASTPPARIKPIAIPLQDIINIR